jgi:hypothetical protein
MPPWLLVTVPLPVPRTETVRLTFAVPMATPMGVVRPVAGPARVLSGAVLPLAVRA